MEINNVSNKQAEEMFIDQMARIALDLAWLKKVQRTNDIKEDLSKYQLTDKLKSN